MNEMTAVGIGAVALFVVWKWVAARVAGYGRGKVLQHLAGGIAGMLVLAAIVGVLAPSRMPAQPVPAASSVR
ncbi:hypothetical protein [Jeongeupia sp. USM3]|uniref:hypothetical protein n=1 Tax=Jeongeupia sp. USM3 TaxID=1906741 RepID=UPI00089DF6D4|nr:hypothetical protein [Jeongeupia sp. USM3]AOX99454.1 hypothetical protein BJP62_02665 [Jeongeupia sp. USM3]